MQRSILVVLLFLSAGAIRADIVTLDFRGAGGAFDFRNDEGSYTTTAADGVAGVNLNFESAAGGSVRATNLVASNDSFGVFSIVGAEQNPVDLLDGENESETVFITFQGFLRGLRLNSIVIGEFDGEDAGFLFVTDGRGNSFTTDILGGSATEVPQFEFERLQVTYNGSGDGFGFNGISFSVAAIPEPGHTLMLILLASIGVFSRNRIR